MRAQLNHNNDFLFHKLRYHHTYSSGMWCSCSGLECVDPEDPTVIAETELLGAAASIEAAAKKLEQLKPRAKPKVQVPFSTFSTHTRKPTNSFQPLISRQATRAKARKGWHRLWSGVIFFTDWVAISMSLKEIFSFCVTHTTSTQTDNPVSQHMMLEKLSSKALWDVILSCAARRRNYSAGSSSLCWNEFKCAMNCCDPFPKERASVLLNLFPLLYCTSFSTKLREVFQPVIHLPYTVLLSLSKTKQL